MNVARDARAKVTGQQTCEAGVVGLADEPEVFASDAADHDRGIVPMRG
jgi:hypothetical protein